jgi:LPS-assembly lipoprotein
MSFSSRRTVLLSLAALAGCGYAPMYAPGGSADTLEGSIAVAGPGSARDFRFVALLEERLGQPSGARYDLGYTLAIDSDAGGILGTGAISRYTLVGTAAFTLTDRTTGEVAGSGSVEAFTNYSATSTATATQAAAQDAEARLLVILADQLVTRLALLDL